MIHLRLKRILYQTLKLIFGDSSVDVTEGSSRVYTNGNEFQKVIFKLRNN